MRRPLPWYWAAPLGFIASYAVFAVIVLSEDRYKIPLTYAEQKLEALVGRRMAYFGMWACLCVPVWFAATGVWAFLRHSKHGPQEHLHCLKCGYILKGLSEPRCPECGERI